MYYYIKVLSDKEGVIHGFNIEFSIWLKIYPIKLEQSLKVTLGCIIWKCYYIFITLL